MIHNSFEFVNSTNCCTGKFCPQEILMHLFPHDLFIDCGNHISEIKVKNIRQKFFSAFASQN